ncbi:MAG: AAA family ATPase [Treponema sp.]
MQERHMPIGIQDFETMRTASYVYVDKTQFIPQLEIVGRAYFLTRPRRFGKSLFISTLQAYFEGRKELFEGLAIEKIKAERGEEWQKYPVLKLDLNAKKYTKEEHLDEVLTEHIDKWKSIYNIECKYKAPESAFAYIIQSLYEKFNQRVVILIDEYDKPLIASIENEELNNAYRATLKAFYSVIKSLNGCIHLSFLTGVTKFSKVSIFSDLNNLDDISFDKEYSSICGITEKELESNFKLEIEELANDCNKPYNEMVDTLRTKYDGYRFSKKEERIYNPFSLLNALAKKELGDYWFETGTPTFMVRLLAKCEFNIPDLEGNLKITLDNLDAYRVAKESFIPLLFQAGYVTIKDYDEELNRYILGFPNDEVRYAFLKQLLKVYTTANTTPDGTFMVDEFLDGIRAGDIERVLTLMKSLIASIPYDSLEKEKLELREHNYQSAIYLVFRLLGQYVRTEVHSSKGRSDVEVETKDAIYIFEFKMKGRAEEAIAQIKEQGYAEKHRASNKNIYLIGASIARGKRTLGKWVVEKV